MTEPPTAPPLGRWIQPAESDFFSGNSTYFNMFPLDFTALPFLGLRYTNQTSKCQTRSKRVVPQWQSRTWPKHSFQGATSVEIGHSRNHFIGCHPRLCKSTITLQKSLASWVKQTTFQEFINASQYIVIIYIYWNHARVRFRILEACVFVWFCSSVGLET